MRRYAAAALAAGLLLVASPATAVAGETDPTPAAPSPSPTSGTTPPSDESPSPPANPEPTDPAPPPADPEPPAAPDEPTAPPDDTEPPETGPPEGEASAQPENPTEPPDDSGDPFFNVGDHTVVPGQRLFVAGGGCDPGATVQISGGGAVIGTVGADDGGRFSGNVGIPRHWVPGHTHQITATCGGTTVGSATVEVIHEAPPVLQIDTTRVHEDDVIFADVGGCEPGAFGEAVDVSGAEPVVLGQFQFPARENGFSVSGPIPVPDSWEPNDRRLVRFTCGDRFIGFATFEVFPADRFFDIDDPETSPGGQIVLDGQSCEPGTEATITSAGVVLATVRADEFGMISRGLPTPANWRPGETHKVTATCADGAVLGTDTVTVVGGPRLIVGDPTVLPGQNLFIETFSCPDDSTLVVRSDGDLLGTVPPDGFGINSGTVRIPDDWEPGTRTITGTCGALTLPPETVSVLPAGSEELPFIEFSDTTLFPGQTVSVRGAGCRRGDTAVLRSLRAGDIVAEFPVNDQGRFSGTVALSPPHTRSGELDLIVVCGQDVIAFTTVELVLPDGGPDGDGDGGPGKDGKGDGDGVLKDDRLPFTGPPGLPFLLGLGLTLVAAGTLLTVRRVHTT